MQPEPMFPFSDDAFDGDQPSREEEKHAADVGYLIWEFQKVAQPGVDIIFEFRNAVGRFVHRNTTMPIDDEDAVALKRAVNSALASALKRPETRRLRFLRRGMAAIIEAVDAWANPPVGKDRFSYLRNATIGALKHEVALADIAGQIAEYSPTTRARRHRQIAGQDSLWAGA